MVAFRQPVLITNYGDMLKSCRVKRKEVWQHTHRCHTEQKAWVLKLRPTAPQEPSLISPEQAAGLDISSTQAADELFAMYGIRGCGLHHRSKTHAPRMFSVKLRGTRS